MPFLPIIPQSLSEPVKSLWVSGSPKSSTVGRETPSHPYRLQNKWVLSLSECVIREESVILEEGRDLFYVRECGAVHCCPWIICIFPFQVPFSATMSPVRLHSSNPNLCADIEFQTPPSHLTDPLESSTDYTKLQEEFCLIAQKGNNKSNTPLKTLSLQQHLFEKLPHYPNPHIPQTWEWASVPSLSNSASKTTFP